ncbi:MAG: hypothetical protein ACI9KE_000023 [Polyangiales bacterium]|jgi:hypothetical protein
MIRTLLALMLFAWSASAHGQDVEGSSNSEPAAEEAVAVPAGSPVPAESPVPATSERAEQAADDTAESTPELSTTQRIRAPADDEQAKEDARDWRFVGAFSIHGSLLSSVAGRSTLDLTYGAALRFGARRGSNQLAFLIDYSGWQSLEDRSVITFATINLAAEYTRTFFSDVVAASLAAGPSILLTETLLDDAGSVGLFVELRPAGFRWRTKHINIGLDPLSFTIVAPVLGALPLVRVQYRTTLTLEFRP